MFGINAALNLKRAVFLLLFLSGTACIGGAEIDKTRYIGVDEIRPGMPAWCLTVFEGTTVEKFDMQVLSVLHDYRPGRKLILVKGTDPRFVHTGPVAGCSGSPLYIDGRLAGALARGWFFSKDPMYGATPIEEMLAVGREALHDDSEEMAGIAIDFSKPLDFTEVYEQIMAAGPSAQARAAGAGPLPIPLMSSGISPEAMRPMGEFLEAFGFIPVGGVSGGGGPGDAESIDLRPGGVLTVPLMTGDIKLFALGTVTDVVGDKVYGFGHNFLGYGKVNLPMATGRVHTVVANLQRSFKVGTTLEIKGALTVDEFAAVYGQIGGEVKMIPLRIKIGRYNDPERIYSCRVVSNRLLTPTALSTALNGAASMKGDLPPDHFIRYRVGISTDGYEPISFQNVSSATGVMEPIRESVAPIALLMSNPYRTVDITSIDFDLQIANENILSHIWSVDLSNTRVKAGGVVEVYVVIESYLSRKKSYKYELQIPENLPPGKYKLTVSGGSGYKGFITKAAPYRFTAENLPTLIEAINNVGAIRGDRLYFVLSLPAGGLAIEKALLPDLPPSKALILTDAKRTLKTTPYEHWIESQVDIGWVIIDKKTVEITVED